MVCEIKFAVEQAVMAQGEKQRHSSTLSLTPALDGSGD